MIRKKMPQETRNKQNKVLRDMNVNHINRNHLFMNLYDDEISREIRNA